MQCSEINLNIGGEGLDDAKSAHINKVLLIAGCQLNVRSLYIDTAYAVAIYGFLSLLNTQANEMNTLE